jgi:hypothetical protein
MDHHQEAHRIPKRDAPGKGPEGVLPDMQARTVVGVFDSFAPARAAVDALKASGASDADISVVMRQEGSAPELGAGETRADTGTVAGASVGVVLGGIAGLAALAIPGIGPILAAGPIAAAIGALTGGALGGLIGSFGGLGIPTEHAEAYDSAVRAGGVVVAVRVPDREAGERVSQVLEQHGARESSSYTQAL